MRIVILGAGADPDATVPYRMRATVTDGDGTHHVELTPSGVWTCTCGPDCDHIAAVRPLAGREQAAPVADGPVTLDAEDARDLLDYQDGVCGHDGWTVVSVTQTGSGRWLSTHRMVIRNERGEHFAATFKQGLTEQQHTQPWEDEESVTFHPVAPRSKVVHLVEWVTPEQSAQ